MNNTFAKQCSHSKCQTPVHAQEQWQIELGIQKSHHGLLGEKKTKPKQKAAQALGLILHASWGLYLEYKQYRTLIIAFVSPFTISVDTQNRENKTRWEVLAIPGTG